MDLSNKLFVKYLAEHGFSGGGGTSYTAEQLAKIRERWHFFVSIRQLLGTCIQCNRKHQPGMQRCGVHRNKNKAKCLAWARKNRLRLRERYRQRVLAKVCADVPSHGPAFDGHIYCKDCYNRHKQHKLKYNQRKQTK